MRATLALGAQPPAPGGGSSMDSVSTRATANPSALSNVAKALKKGPASAVDDVDELYGAEGALRRRRGRRAGETLKKAAVSTICIFIAYCNSLRVNTISID